MLVVDGGKVGALSSADRTVDTFTGSSVELVELVVDGPAVVDVLFVELTSG